MARGLNVFVNIGAKVGSSVNSAASATERRFRRMGASLTSAASASGRGFQQMGATLNSVAGTAERRFQRMGRAARLNAVANGMMAMSKSSPGLLKFITYSILAVGALAPLGFAFAGVGGPNTSDADAVQCCERRLARLQPRTQDDWRWIAKRLARAVENGWQGGRFNLLLNLSR